MKLKFLVGLAHKITAAIGTTDMPQVREQLGILAANAGMVEAMLFPGSPIKLSDTAAWRWISGQDGGSRSVLYHATRSICWCCTLGESEYRAVQPPRVRSLVLGQGGALPPDTVAGGETRDAA